MAEFAGRPLPLPVAATYGAHFRDYGGWIMILIVAWAAIALHSRGSQTSSYPRTTAIVGALLVFLFIVAAVFFAGTALMMVLPST